MNTPRLRLTFVLTMSTVALIGSLALLTLPDQAVPAHASPNSIIRYVATTGDDNANNCSIGPCRTVQHAVDIADIGDEIRVATGVYTEVGARPRKDSVATSVVTQVVYISKTVTIRGGYSANFSVWNPDAHPTTLDAQGRGRALYLTGYHTAAIESLRITGGNATGMGGSDLGDAGGGLYVHQSRGAISNCQVFSNTAPLYGGGIYLSWSSATLDGNTVVANTAGDAGGGMFLFYSGEATLNGNAILSNTANWNGGGVYLSNTSATLNGNTISNNTAMTFDGGGLHLTSSGAVLVNNRIAGNTAHRDGGGVSLQSSPARLSSNTIVSNSADHYGGGLYLRLNSQATINGNRVISNTASDSGGGLYLDASPARLTGNTIFANAAQEAGGGLYVFDSDATLNRNNIISNTTRLGGGMYLMSNAGTFDGNTILSNTAQVEGGGLYLNINSATLTNNVVADNWAKNTGSGLCILQSTPRLLHTTIARNIGGDGSGVYVTTTGAYSAIALTNTILVSQSVGITATVGNTATLDGVMWYKDTDNTGGAGIITVTNAMTGNPIFAPDGYHLTAASAAIGKGVTGAGVTADVDGNPRDAAPDLGADEYFDACRVRLNDAPTDYVTVQSAVDASTRPTDVVKVAGYCADMQPRAGLMQVVYLSKTLTLRGGYTVTNWTTPDPIANPSTLDAVGQGRVLYISGNITPVIESLGIVGGSADGLGGRGGTDVGGGVYAETANTVLNNCRVFNNAADEGGGLYLSRVSNLTALNGNAIVSNTATVDGGGLLVDHSLATLDNNQFVSNTAHFAGGGVYVYFSSATLNGNRVFANAVSGYGGGVYVYQSSATLNGNDIASNAAAQRGAGLDLDNSTAALNGNIIWGNVVSIGHGGGLALVNSPTTLTNTVIADNRSNLAGGGMYIEGASQQLLHTTLARNTTSNGDGSGLDIQEYGPMLFRAASPSDRNSTVTLINTILVSHTQGITITAGNTATLNGVLWYSNTTNYDGAGAITVTNAITGDPVFAADGYHLTAGSKVINAGVPSNVATDIDREPRLGLPDLGADEYVLHVFLPVVLRQ